ncbi:MAG: cation:proton antiporter [Bryobacteraceae bacterium]|jgi:Kef-type K+ transport system membrane component KefB
MPNLFTLILQIGVVLLAARIVGALFRRIHQPRVVGEMAAGIMLGPSLLGWLAPRASTIVFPPASLTYLSGLSQIGVVLFMFLVGLSINPAELRKQGRAAVLVSHVSIVLPFGLAFIMALFLYPEFSGNGVKFTSFALFMGSAMSITAFPVLARILAERALLGTRMGTLAIACAAVDDVTGWCVLAFIVALIRASRSPIPVWVTLAGAAAFVLAMVFGVRRLCTRFETTYLDTATLTDGSVSTIILFVLASALITEALGIHLLFGAFLAGSVLPRNQAFVRELQSRFESVTVLLLLPLFFAVTGLRTSVGAIRGAGMWGYCAAIVVVAIAGKLGGSLLAARAAGIAWRDSAALGILMNTRGLMELVILNIGLDLGIISPAMFSMMVLMALITTFMTTPLLHLVYPGLNASSTGPNLESPTLSPLLPR